MGASLPLAVLGDGRLLSTFSGRGGPPDAADSSQYK